MTRTSDNLRAIAEGAAARARLFDEYSPRERSLPDALQGVADAIEEDALAGGAPATVTDGTGRLDEAWVRWLHDVLLPVMDAEGVDGTPEQLRRAAVDRAGKLMAGGVAEEDAWHDWALRTARALGMDPGGWAGERVRDAVTDAVSELRHACLELRSQLDAVESCATPAQPQAPAGWPLYDDGAPVQVGDVIERKVAARIIVTQDGWKVCDAGKHPIASGTAADTVDRTETVERVLADLEAMGYKGPQLEQLTELVRRAAKAGGAV